MDNKENKYTLIDIILMTLLFISTLLAVGIEFYFTIILKNKPIIFSELNPFQQKLFIVVFISLVIMLMSFIIIVISTAKNEESSFKNYVFIKKEDYKALQERSLEQEYENMKQDVEINTLKVKLSSLKLKLKILKKIFKHRKDN